jgi:hypothetical protein
MLRRRIRDPVLLAFALGVVVQYTSSYSFFKGQAATGKKTADGMTSK